MQKEDEAEVVHLEWERVKDPTRYPQPEPQDSAIREFLDRPNPMRDPAAEAAFWIIWIAISVGAVLAQWAARV